MSPLPLPWEIRLIVFEVSSQANMSTLSSVSSAVSGSEEWKAISETSPLVPTSFTPWPGVSS